MHVDDPLAVLYCPAEQFKHMVMPAEKAKVPITHCKHEEEVSDEE